MIVGDRVNKGWDICGRLRGMAARARFVVGSRCYLSGDVRGARRWAEGPAAGGDGRCRLLLGLCLYDEICEDLSGEQGMEKLAAACRMMEELERLEALDHRLAYLACMHLALVYRSAGESIRPPGDCKRSGKSQRLCGQSCGAAGDTGTKRPQGADEIWQRAGRNAFLLRFFLLRSGTAEAIISARGRASPHRKEEERARRAAIDKNGFPGGAL